MYHKNRRRHFLINKSLQFRYMVIVSSILLGVISVSLISLYFGIWGGVLEAFSNEKIQNDLLLASRIQQYEEARVPHVQPSEPFTALSLIRQSDRLSQRQREIFRNILSRTNRNLITKLILLFILIAWGSIYLSHKIAGPLYRFQKIFEAVREGDFSIRCHLRKSDEAKALANSLNQTIQFLDLEMKQLKSMVDKGEKNPANMIQGLKENLSKFKTTS